MNASGPIPRNQRERDIKMMVEAVSDALKTVLPGMITKEVSRQLAEQARKHAGVTREELATMGERHRQNLLARGINPETLQRFAPGEQQALNEARAALRKPHAAQGMTGAAARRQHR